MNQYSMKNCQYFKLLWLIEKKKNNKIEFIFKILNFYNPNFFSKISLYVTNNNVFILYKSNKNLFFFKSLTNLIDCKVWKTFFYEIHNKRENWNFNNDFNQNSLKVYALYLILFCVIEFWI